MRFGLIINIIVIRLLYTFIYRSVNNLNAYIITTSLKKKKTQL